MDKLIGAAAVLVAALIILGAIVVLSDLLTIWRTVIR
jgi:hypothetical protein